MRLIRGDIRMLGGGAAYGCWLEDAVKMMYRYWKPDWAWGFVIVIVIVETRSHYVSLAVLELTM